MSYFGRKHPWVKSWDAAHLSLLDNEKDNACFHYKPCVQVQTHPALQGAEQIGGGSQSFERVRNLSEMSCVTGAMCLKLTQDRQ
jgi:hypothetical protein